MHPGPFLRKHGTGRSPGQTSSFTKDVLRFDLSMHYPLFFCVDNSGHIVRISPNEPRIDFPAAAKLIHRGDNGLVKESDPILFLTVISQLLLTRINPWYSRYISRVIKPATLLVILSGTSWPRPTYISTREHNARSSDRTQMELFVDDYTAVSNTKLGEFVISGAYDI